MKTTLFGSKIIEAAEEVLSIGYRAGSRNCYGEKLEQVVKEFDLLQPTGQKYFTGSGKKQVDYCAITQGVILDRAFKKYNNSVNAIRSASAKYFLDEANRRKIRVDKTPQPGCLFITKRSGGSGYHVGMVWKLEGSGFRTIEGNTYSSSSYNIANGCKVKLRNTEYGILSRYRTKGNIHAFLHFEELFDKTLSEYADSETYLADEADACFYGEMPAVEKAIRGLRTMKMNYYLSRQKNTTPFSACPKRLFI